MLPSGGEEGVGAASAAAPGTSSPADGALVARLMDASRGAGASLLVSHLRSSGADAAATAEALLSQPQAQLRAHGLLAARLAGRADLVLGVLVGGDAGVWKAASPLLCQMDPGPACTAQLLDWLLHAAPPAHRNDFLTRLGRLPPRQLGAALFAALLAEGRVEAALRLVRHAGEQADAELAPLLREQLVERQVGAACCLWLALAAFPGAPLGRLRARGLPTMQASTKAAASTWRSTCFYLLSTCRGCKAGCPPGPARPGSAWLWRGPCWRWSCCGSCGAGCSGRWSLAPVATRTAPS